MQTPLFFRPMGRKLAELTGRTVIKRLLLKAVNALGYDLAPRRSRASLVGVLANAKRCGMRVGTVIDVGAGRGDFSRAALSQFPDALSLLVEPLSEFESALDSFLAKHPRSKLFSGVASSQAGNVALNVHPDLFGSSLLLESKESASVNGKPRMVCAARLDDLAKEMHLEEPFLLKIDVQGAELSVLDGARDVLERSDLVVLETSFFQFFDDGPLFLQVADFMQSKGFALYDLFGLAHRPLDGALAQADVVFAKADGALRRHHHYATPQQRETLTKRLVG